MQETPIHILVYTTDPQFQKQIDQVISRIPELQIHTTLVSDAGSLWDQFEQSPTDIFMLDLENLSDDWKSVLIRFRRKFPALPTVTLVPLGNQEIVAETIQAGATDYLVKGSLHPRMIEKTIRLCLNYKQLRSSYLEQRVNFARLFRHSHDAILLVDEVGNIEHVNPSFSDKFGLSTEDLEGENLSKLLVGKPGSLQDILGMIKTEPSVKVKIKGQDEQELICQLALTPLGDGQGYQVILLEITRFLEAQERAKRAERLGISGRIARGLAHEIRNPLSNISLSSHQLAEDLKEMPDAQLYLDIIQRNVDRISHLIDAILDSSRNTGFAPRKTSVNALFQEAYKICQDRITLRGVEVEKDFTPEENEIVVDPERVRLALVNLIMNAVEATRESEQPRLVLRSRLVNDGMQLEVADNGVGMTEKTRRKIFQPFFTTKKSGVGLGMLSIQNVVRSHGGTLRVNSTLGEGTTFILWMPPEPIIHEEMEED